MEFLGERNEDRKESDYGASGEMKEQVKTKTKRTKKNEQICKNKHKMRKVIKLFVHLLEKSCYLGNFFAILFLFFQRLPSQMDTIYKSSALLGPGIGLLGMLDNRFR